MVIVDRQCEQKQPQKIFQSNEAGFVAIYGRRIRKAYFLRKFFDNKLCISFRFSGLVSAYVAHNPHLNRYEEAN
jgi:hypothetical protein